MSLWSFLNVICPDNKKFRKFSKIGVWSYLGGPYGHEGMVCQSGACAGFTLSDLRALQNRRPFGSTMLGDKMHKTPFLQANLNSIF